jgi:hypothetical protein
MESGKTPLNILRAELTLGPGGNVSAIKAELVRLSLDHHCVVKAEIEGDDFEVDSGRLLTEGMPEV